MSVTPCLRFNGNAEEAVNFYVSLVPNSRIVETAAPRAASRSCDRLRARRHPLPGAERRRRRPFTEAVSLMVTCDTQAELDRIWDRIVETGGKPLMCGWIKDRYGLPWQVVPAGSASG